jgi:protein-S-isoprenylcysteine O-methyltransferase Ste14
VPWLITRRQSGSLDGGWPTRLAAAALALGGLAGLLESFARFALSGRGTPAPIAPTENLVVGGFYRYVRNPMYLAVLALVFAQGLWLRQSSLLIYGAILWLVFDLFVRAYEEPTLHRQFPGDYPAYRANVRRWLPRSTPWDGLVRRDGTIYAAPE